MSCSGAAVRIDGKNVLLTGALGSLGRAQALRRAAAAQGCFFSTDRVTKTARHLLRK